jgi:hypothetical protein
MTLINFCSLETAYKNKNTFDFSLKVIYVQNFLQYFNFTQLTMFFSSKMSESANY